MPDGDGRRTERIKLNGRDVDAFSRYARRQMRFAPGEKRYWRKKIVRRLRKHAKRTLARLAADD